MPYHLYAGPNLEELLKKPSIMNLFQPEIFHQKTWFMIQNHNLTQWLKIWTAENVGVYSGLRFDYLDSILRCLIEPFQENQLINSPVLYMDDLKLVIYSRLQNWIKDPDKKDLFPALRSFFTRCETSNSPSALFEMSDAIAGLFHNYCMNSEFLPEYLSQGKAPEDFLPDQSHFSWQCELWKEIFGKGDSYAPYTHLGLELRRISRRIVSGRINPLPSLPMEKLVIFGSAFLNPQAYGFLRNLCKNYQNFEIHHLLFWPFQQSPLNLNSDIYKNLSGPGSLWGGFGYQFSEIFRTDPPDSFFPGDAKPLANEQSALGRIQKSIFQDEKILGWEDFPKDDTFKINACTGERREIEVLKNEVHEILKNYPKNRLDQMAVVAPDLREYGPFIPGSFSHEQSISCNWSEGSPPPLTPYFSGWKSILNLLEKGFSRSQAFDLFLNPCFCRAQNISSSEAAWWLRFIHDTKGFRQEDQTGPHSFERSFQRLWQGAAFQQKGNFDPQLWNDQPLYPWSTSGTNLQNLGKLYQTLEILKTALPRKEMSFQFWLECLEDLENKLLKVRDGMNEEMDQWDRSLIRNIRAKLGALEKKDLILPFAAFRCFINDQIKHHSQSSGSSLARGLNFASIKSFRGVPFSSLMILGLSDKRFPSNPQILSFDLMVKENKERFLDQESSDRYAFLESILNTKECLVLSYKGASEQDNSEQPPSQVIEELLDWLGIAPGLIVQKQKVHDFDNGYFTSGHGLYSYDETAAELSQSLTDVNPRSSDEKNFWVDHSISRTKVLQAVSWYDIEKMIRNPLKFFLKKALDINLFEDETMEWKDKESWEIDDYQFLDSFFKNTWNTLLEGKNPITPQELLDHYQGAGLVIPGPFSQIQKYEWENVQENLKTIIADEGFQFGEVVDCPDTWAGSPLSGKISSYINKSGQTFVPYIHSGSISHKHKLAACLRTFAFLAWTKDTNLKCASPLFLNVKRGEKGQYLEDFFTHEEAVKILNLTELFWTRASEQAFPIYGDFLEKLKKSIEQNSLDELSSLEWNHIWKETVDAVSYNQFKNSDSSKDCPARILIFPEGISWDEWAEKVTPWIKDLYFPLMGNWKKKTND